MSDGFWRYGASKVLAIMAVGTQNVNLTKFPVPCSLKAITSI
jgi:hypothetical protein